MLYNHQTYHKFITSQQVSSEMMKDGMTVLNPCAKIFGIDI
jgi:hypothetical protein